jgi:hypothetical protein
MNMPSINVGERHYEYTVNFTRGEELGFIRDATGLRFFSRIPTQEIDF